VQCISGAFSTDVCRINDDIQEFALCEFCSQMCVSSERLVVVDNSQVRPVTNLFTLYQLPNIWNIVFSCWFGT
jgi:hypothetical protein